MSEKPDELRKEIVTEYETWREKFLDLPVVLMLLGRIKGILSGLKAGTNIRRDWEYLKAQGVRLSHRRSLLAATEAIGQMPVATTAEIRASLRENLGVLIGEGTSLHKVRALRAMRFIASEECIPHLERALCDSSSWVQATALHTLFRLNLRQKRTRWVLLRFIARSFWHSLAPWRGHPDSILKLFKGLVAGLLKESGGRGFAALVALLATIALLWIIVVGVAWLAGMFVFIVIAFALCLAAFPVLLRLLHRSDPRWPALVFDSALDYAMIVSAYFLLPPSHSSMAIPTFLFLYMLVISVLEQKSEPGLHLIRIGLTVYIASMAPLWSSIFVLFVVLGVCQCLWLGFLARKQFAKLLGEPTLVVVGTLIGLPLILVVTLVVSAVVIAGGLLAWPVVLFKGEKRIASYIRMRLLSSRQSYFRSLSEYLAYVISASRRPWIPVGTRVRAVLSLAEFPLADQAIIGRLMDWAEEDLPAQVRDAIYQVVDAAEKRVQRGQAGSIDLDAGILEQRIAPRVPPGEILRPFVSLGLLLILVILLVLAVEVVAAIGAAFGVFTEYSALFQIVLGASLLVYALVGVGKESTGRMLSLMLGLGLFGVLLSHPLQRRMSIGAGNGGYYLFLIAPAWLCLMGMLAGRLLYVLDCDIPVDTESHRGKLGRLGMAGLTVVSILCIAVQSVPLQDYISVQAEAMPVFVIEGSGEDVLALHNVPRDGRVVRVALVELANPTEFPALKATFPMPATQESILRAAKAKDPAQVLPTDEICKGEIWVSSDNGRLYGWESLPNGCLGIVSVEEGDILFSIRSGCVVSPTARLVAIVYPPRQSGAVRKRAQPARVVQQIEASPSTVILGIPGLLANTLSLSVRAVWSPPISATQPR